MKRSILFIFLICTFFSGLSNGQPLETVKNFLGSRTYEDSKKFVCCSMLQPDHYRSDFSFYILGEPVRGIHPRIITGYDEIYSNDSAALIVARLSEGVASPSGDTAKNEMYLFISNTYAGWKIEDYRIREIPLRWEEERMLELSTARGFLAPLRLDRLKLFLASNDEKANYFYMNKDKFISLLAVADTLSVFPYDQLSEYGRARSENPWMPELLLSSIYKNYLNLQMESESPYYKEVTFFAIEHYSGEMDGYIYAKDVSEILADYKTFTLLESLGDGWYMFKALHL